MCSYDECNLRDLLCDYIIDELGADEDDILDYDDEELLDEIRGFIDWLCREVAKKERATQRLEGRLFMASCPSGNEDYGEFDDLDCEADE